MFQAAESIGVEVSIRGVAEAFLWAAQSASLWLKERYGFQLPGDRGLLACVELCMFSQ